MKRVVKAASDGPVVLKLQWLSKEDYKDMLGVRPVTIRRPTLHEALEAMLDRVELRTLDIDYDDFEEWPTDDIIERIQYVNGDDLDSDYILYLENVTSGDVYIDNNYSEEEW